MKNFKPLIKNCRYIIIQILVSLIVMILLKRLSIFQAVNAINTKDYPIFTRCLESAYNQMYERHHDGLEPDHIYV